MSTLEKDFKNKVAEELMKTGEFKNPFRVPHLIKIVINRGVGETRENSKAIDVSAKELAEITGQQPLIIKAKKAIAAFKLRKDLPIGLKVTLRGRRMYGFLLKFVNVCLPKIRDFRGVSTKSFDGRGNYNMGIREQLIFPEVDYEKIDRVRGMDITFVTSARNDKEARQLLQAFGVPFRKDG
ncbi:50S ribosomal protein L5 [candidate division WOR-1 bacterium RIFOXYB2_FULL_42_35]|uniref:Large ribosomal subunit protein uL5 n=1 Tax=candidate division WOR-1 bacterium RIFOXYC2_FULL_41_25 TaxID=1802586 RepID=A0A1F4TLY0_UNCSA|nr:MAG: 50S ribosomal protein L5 [candidate division WOR-1 bacterium RIFOXYA2_FULL_41_14]OGC23866.1 MAG: 50S ribosomal protein L5 [candidate division WOR-1 bacterium RIFOXYB2_FULL_42_35]OGC33741.1 MAG: 50S ribosomal protein L5 [candidate division WOR-1 bacterium RIFOXYC2_FULL_41_25]OGC42504.1 MAG: 50S ribosomal protein L5 [candidate division WOR-1 bacterium RIFOXYD2_FULL_41_8]